MLTLAAALALSAPALAAEDEAAPAAPPLAVPAEVKHPDPLTRTQLARTYRAQRLEVLPELEFTPGYSTVYRRPWGWGPRGRYYGYSPVTVMHTPPTAENSWGIYQGGARIDVPTWLELTGQYGELTEVTRTLEERTRRARVGYTLLGVGAAALVGGTVARGLVETPEAYEAAAWTSLGGAGLTIGGLLGGAIASGRADILRNRPAEYMDPGEVRGVADDYNDELARELGLSPQDRSLIDSERVPVRRKKPSPPR